MSCYCYLCSCLATSGDGYVVVGAEDGKVLCFLLCLTKIDVYCSSLQCCRFGCTMTKHSHRLRHVFRASVFQSQVWMSHSMVSCAASNIVDTYNTWSWIPLTAGKWVVASTRSYLMVVKTNYRDPTSGRELCGFTSRLGGSAPAPRLLRLRAEDTLLTSGAPLEKAHFTWVTEYGRSERWIVATCGNFTILWNFRYCSVNDVRLALLN